MKVLVALGWAWCVHLHTVKGQVGEEQGCLLPAPTGPLFPELQHFISSSPHLTHLGSLAPTCLSVYPNCSGVCVCVWCGVFLWYMCVVCGTMMCVCVVSI